MLPILASALIGMAAKVGLGLAATAAKKLFTSGPAPAAVAPRRTFAEELDRARPSASVAPAASVVLPALPASEGVAARPASEAPPLTTDARRLALSTGSGRRRAGLRMARFGRHHVAAYQRMDIGPR